MLQRVFGKKPPDLVALVSEEGATIKLVRITRRPAWGEKKIIR
jgi:hypothetical protein